MISNIMIMLDDTANYFTQAIRDLNIKYDNRFDDIANRNFANVFFDKHGNLTENGIKAFTQTKPFQDGIDFINSFHTDCSKVVLCTSRDIRLCYNETVLWLKTHGVLYDYLFTATAPAGLCLEMGIKIFIYNLPDEENRDHINICKFNKDGNRELYEFSTFKEAKSWININY